jgi:type I restriction enzyme M protein
VATFDEVKDNDFNLNIPRYVDTFEEEEEIDIIAVQSEIDVLTAQLTESETKMQQYIKDLGFRE